MHIFGKFVLSFGKLAHIFGKFAQKLVSRTSKQVSINLGPLWPPGVYNDTKQCPTGDRKFMDKLFGGKFFYLQLELFCLQLSFCAYSPLRPLLDALFPL